MPDQNPTVPQDQPIEIFDATTHEQVWPRTEGDLDAIVASYDASLHEAPVILDHDRGRGGDIAPVGPAYGWVRKIARQGTKLVAWLRDVAPELRELVRVGRYKNRSVELYPPANKVRVFGGQPYLRAVAFLGAAVPACKGLAPVSLGEMGEGFLSFEEPGSAADAAPGSEEARNMDQIAELTAKVEALTQETTALKGENATLKEQVAAFAEAAEKQKSGAEGGAGDAVLKAENEALKAKVLAFEEAEKLHAEETRKSRCEGWFSELVRAAKALPTEHDAVVAMFSAVDEAQGKALFEAFKARPAVVELGVRKFQEAKGDDGTQDPLAAALEKDARSRAKG